MTGSVGRLSSLRLEAVTDQAASRLWNGLIARWHYLGYRPLPGAQLRYLIHSDEGILGAIGFGAAAWKVAARDRWIGWGCMEREACLGRVLNNARFLILLDSYQWARKPGSLGQTKDASRPLEEKESVRWVDGFARVNALAEQLTETRLTDICDREGDIDDLFVEAPCPERGADWLVRAQHRDRLLVDGRKLSEIINAAPVLTEITFHRPASGGRSARTVEQKIKVVQVTLKAPPRPDRTLNDVTVTALLATEPNPPAGEDPLDWLLLTNLPVETSEEAIETLQWYLCRWQIEIHGPHGRHPRWLPQPKIRWLPWTQGTVDRTTACRRFCTRPGRSTLHRGDLWVIELRQGISAL